MSGRSHIFLAWVAVLGLTLSWAAAASAGPVPARATSNPAAVVRGAAPARAQDSGIYWEELMPPMGRYLHSAVYDASRSRVVVFGGQDSTTAYYNDVWALSMSGVPAWSPLAPLDSVPSARCGQSVIYDPSGERLILFGGRDASGLDNDVWALSLTEPPVWTHLRPSGTPPPARCDHVAVYDPTLNRMVVACGTGVSSYLNDAWTLSLDPGAEAWAQFVPGLPGPSARAQASAYFDPDHIQMVLFGGRTGAGPVNDVWTLDLSPSGAGWSWIIPDGTPPSPRCGAGTVFDPVHDRALLVGGTTPGGPTGEVWAISLAAGWSWSQLSPGGPAFTPRTGCALVFDSDHNQVVAVGGKTATGRCLNDAEALSVGASPAWSVLTPHRDVPATRRGHMTVYDSQARRMVVFGGSSLVNGFLDDVWTASGVNPTLWTRLTPSGTAPAAREQGAAIYDPVRNRMLVFGGSAYGGPPYYGDVWALSLGGTPTWTQLSPAGTPPHFREGAAGVYDPVRDRMLIFGGDYWTPSEHLVVLNDVWELSLSGTPTWTQLSPTGPLPDPRFDHTMVYDPVNDQVLAYGGFDYTTQDMSGELWALPLSGTLQWQLLSPIGTSPPGLLAPSAVYDPTLSEMLLFGGRDDLFGHHNEVWALALSGDPAWSLVDAGAPLPSGRCWAGAAYDSSADRLLVFGGDQYVPAPTNEIEVGDLWALHLGGTTVGVRPVAASARLSFAAPRPNPAPGHAAFSFSLPAAAQVRLRVYDVTGRAVATLVNGPLGAGEHHAVWDGRLASGARAAAGIYLCELRADGVRLTRRVTLLR